jgi:apolipoprotein N-acyltransferase
VSGNSTAGTAKDGAIPVTSTRLLFVWPWLAAAASGALLGLCFPPCNQGWLVWLALAPLICALWFSGGKTKRPGLRNTSLGFTTGATFFLVSLHWLTTVHAAGWVALSLYLALFHAAWGWFAGGVTKDRDFLTSRRNLLVALQCAAAWTALEWLRGWLFSGFGWNALGVALHADIINIQIAGITGVAGLTFLVCFTNIIAVITVRRFIAEVGRVRIRPHWDFSATVLLIVLVFAFGVRVLLKKETPGTQMTVAAIQPDIPQNENGTTTLLKASSGACGTSPSRRSR